MRRAFILTSLAVLLAVPQAEAIYLQPYLSGLRAPVLVTHAGDGTNRLFVVELAGVIKVVASGSATTATFLDIEDRVLDGGERGLLGLAFHPQFSSNDRFFVHYTREPDGATVVAEYAASGTAADSRATERILLVVEQPFANHNGGSIAFGPDGYLYIGLGDGGSSNDPQNRAQNVEDLLGKILRIDVDGAEPYEIPVDNPFAGAIPGRGEIFAIGLRNPYRFSFDRATGDLLVGDVGQGQREEIDRVTRGANLGWHRYEGTRCTGLDPSCDATGLTPPIAEYDHSGGRCSVTGGYVYRGARGAVPDGTYVFADFCSGEIFALLDGTVHVLLDTNISVSSLGEDEAGELYVVGLGGTVHRLLTHRYAPIVSSLADLDGNGNADVVWRHSVPGLHAFWFMRGSTVDAMAGIGVGGEWRLELTGDLDGDGRADLVWRSGITGALAIWLMSGPVVLETVAFSIPAGWDLVAAGDITGDGRADLLWRSTASGTLACWEMRGTSVSAMYSFGVGPGWELVGLGDVDADGTSDIVWTNSSSGQLALWIMAEGRVRKTSALGVGQGWTIVGVGDANGDARDDLHWRHTPSGLYAVWLMAGEAPGATRVLGVPSDWAVAGVGDLDANGNADLLWHHAATNRVAFWLMQGDGSATPTVVGVAPDWMPMGAAR